MQCQVRLLTVPPETITPVLLDKTIDTKDSMYTATGGAIAAQANSPLACSSSSSSPTHLDRPLIVLAAIVLIRLYLKVSKLAKGGARINGTPHHDKLCRTRHADNSFMIDGHGRREPLLVGGERERERERERPESIDA